MTEMLVVPKFSWSEITCGEGCWRAVTHDCKCSCGGKNHGIWLKGGKAERTHKHNGHRYKLVRVGTDAAEIASLQKELLIGYGIMRCYDYYGKGEYLHQTYADHFRCRGDKDIGNFPVITKTATLEQCHRWPELAEYQHYTKSDWYRKAPKLLWEIMDKPSPVKHQCDKEVGK